MKHKTMIRNVVLILVTSGIILGTVFQASAGFSMNSKGKIALDQDGDGTAEIVFDATDFTTLYERCK